MDLGWASKATSSYWPYLPRNLPTSLQLSSALDSGFSEHPEPWGSWVLGLPLQPLWSRVGRC